MSKVLYITNQAFPSGRVDVDILFGEKLPERGYRIDGTFQSPVPTKAYRTSWGLGIAWVAGRTDSGLPAARFRNCVRRLGNILQVLISACRADYDLLQVRDGYLSGFLVLIAARILRRPFVYWMSFPVAEHRLYRGRVTRGVGSFLDRLQGRLSRAILCRLLLPRANHVFVQSQRMADDLAERCLHRNRMTPVPMGVDPSTTEPLKIAKPPGERWIGYLGTLDRIRNIDVIVRAFAVIEESCPDTRLILAGGSEQGDVASLRELIKDLKLENKVLITGQRPRAEALGYIQACDVCLSPYAPLPILQSTSPTKLIEYMFLARPVVASEHPEQRELLCASGCGILVKHEPAAYAEAAIALLDDPKRCAYIGALGRAWVLRHRTYDGIASEVDRRYRSLLVDFARSRNRQAAG